MDWDYDVAVNKAQQPKIEWVAPTEGMHAYLEGFSRPSRPATSNLVQEFMNFLLEPKQYAQFVNATGTAYVVPGATPYVKSSISKNPILVPNKADPGQGRVRSLSRRGGRHSVG